MKTATGRPSRVSVPSGKGSKVEMAVTINRPVSEVYQFWRQLENLPRFMNHLESVTQQDSKHSRWTVRTPRDKLVHWDAEITEDLYRLKSLLESGEIPTTEGQPRGGKGGGR